MMRLNDKKLYQSSQATGVFLKQVDYQTIYQALEVALKSIRAYDAFPDEKINAQPSLGELLECAAANKERLTLTYEDQLFLAVVPVEDIKVIAKLQQCMDNYAHQKLKPIHVKNAARHAPFAIEDFVDNKSAENARITLIYQKKVFLAVVPIEDAYLIEELEDIIDNANADEALLEPGTISKDQADKILGW